MNSSLRHTLTVLIALGCHATVWWLAFDLYPKLPMRIPIKYDLAGNPVRFVEANGGEWFALPAIATLITLILLAVGPLASWLARENPEFINVPYKESFKQRSKEERCEIIAPIGRALVQLAIVVNALFAWILYGTERIGNDAWTHLPSWPLWTFFVLLAVILIPAIVTTTRAARPDPADSTESKSASP